MKLNQGLWLDSSETNQPQGTWRNLLNGVFDVDRNVITDEDGFRKFSKNLPTSKDCIGAVTIDDEIVLFMVGATSTTGEIGILSKNGYYDKIISASLFNFSTNFPIKTKYLKNFNKERIIVFIDENNTPKIINLDDLIYTLDSSRVYSGTNINNYELFPKSQEPRLIEPSVHTGGSLLSGTYFISFQYETEYGITTGWNNQSLPFYVTSSGNQNVYGSDSEQLSSRLIEFSLDKIDTDFDKINIALISELNGVSAVKLVKTLNITSATINNITISSNIGIDLTFEELLSPFTNYIRIKDIEITEDEFLGANVVEEEEIEFQQFANMITIDYVLHTDFIFPSTSDIDRSNFSSTFKNTVGTEKGWRSGEVYSFYCSLLLKKGGESRLFHIPGRAPVGTEATDLTQYRTGGANPEGLNDTVKKFRIEDTSSTATAATNMGYWENEDETYPSTDDYDSSGLGGLDLRGQNVRHHRFPTQRAARVALGSTSFFGITQLNNSKIKVSNIVISSEIANKIHGVKIYYAKRDIENMTCLGQSIFQYNHQDTGSTVDYMAGLGNFNIVAVGNSDRIKPSQGSMRFYDFALTNTQVQIAPTYITNQVTITATMNNAAVAFNSSNGEFAEASGTGASGFRRSLINYTETGAPFLKVGSAVVDSSYLKRVQDYKYITDNIVSGDINNIAGEQYIDIKYDSSNADLSILANANDTTNVFNPGTSNWTEKLYITDLNRLLENVYSGINRDREVVCCHDSLFGQYIEVTGATTLNNHSFSNGDNFIEFHTIKRHCLLSSVAVVVVDPLDPIGHAGLGGSIFKPFLHESIQNVGMRFEGIESMSKYFPLTRNSQETLKKNLVFNPTPINYNNDFNQLNEDNLTIIFDIEDEITSKHPFRIIRSSKIGREDENLVLKFPPLSFYEMPKKRGEIVGINAVKDKLIIRHEDGTYITRGKQKLTTDEGDATLGSNDLFEIEPKELFTTDQGYIKSKGIFDALSTEQGLVIVDRQEGRVFNIAQDAIDLTVNESGVRSFFLEEFTKMEDSEIKILYTTVVSTLSTFDSSNRIKIQIPIATFTTITINDFNKGEFIWLDTEAVFSKILRVFSEPGFVTLETDFVDSTPTNQTFKHYRKVNSPFYNDGVIIGWDKDRNTLLITKKCTLCLPKSQENRYIGRRVGGTDFTNDLNVGDIVRIEDTYQVWNGSTFLFTITLEDRSFTLSFNFNKKRWISFHSYIPNLYIYQNDRILSFDGVSEEIYKHHQKNRKGQYYSDTRKNFEINVIFNQGDKFTKKFFNINWVVNFLNTGVLAETKTFDSIQCSNSYDDLGLINLTPFINLAVKGNVRNIKGTWNFNKLKNNDNNLLSDKYLLVIFRDSDENSLFLYDVNTSFNLLDKQ